MLTPAVHYHDHSWRVSAARILAVLAIAVVSVLLWRGSSAVVLLSRSDLSAKAADQAAQAIRHSGFLVPGGSVDPFSLNDECISSDAVPVLIRLEGATTLGAITQLWESSTHQVILAHDGVYTTAFSPLRCLFMHLAIMLTLAATLALRSGLIHPSRPVTRQAMGFITRAWLVGSLVAGVAAIIPWALIGPAEFFWSSLWWRGQGHDWIIMSHGALQGPTVGAIILYLLAASLTAIWMARRFVPRPHRDGACRWCGYDMTELDRCPECGKAPDEKGYDRKARRMLAVVSMAALAGAALAFAAPLVFGVARAISLMGPV